MSAVSSTRVPELRFKGFTDNWEERKLGIEAKITAGGDIDKSKVKKYGRYPIFANALTNDGLVGYYDSFYKIEAPAVTVTGRGDVGHAKARKVNFTPVVRLLSVKSDHDVDFLENILNKHKVLVESTGVPQLTAPQLGNYKIFFSNDSEERKIGAFFKQLDKLITLQQRKIDLLKKQKQGYLQKMFPKAGERVPELRFAGFSDNWKLLKAKDIFKSIVEKGKENLPVLSVTQDNGVVYREKVGIDIKYDTSTLNNYKVIHPGNFVISLRSFQGGFELSDKFGITSPAYTIFEPNNKENNDNLFWKTKFKTFNFIQSLKTVTFGIRDGKSISFSEFGDLKIVFPSKIEQKKIGSFFKQIDENINLQSKKLDSLKELKKGFLQKMFI